MATTQPQTYRNAYDELYQNIIDALDLNPDFSFLGSSELAMHIQTVAINEFEKKKREILRSYNKRLYQMSDRLERQKFLSNNPSMEDGMKKLEPLKDQIAEYIKRSLSQSELAAGENPLLDEFRAYSQMYRRVQSLIREKTKLNSEMKLQQRMIDAHLSKPVRDTDKSIKSHRGKAQRMNDAIEEIGKNIISTDREIQEMKRGMEEKKGNMEDMEDEITRMQKAVVRGDFSDMELSSLSIAFEKSLLLPDFNALFSRSYNYGGRN